MSKEEGNSDFSKFSILTDQVIIPPEIEIETKSVPGEEQEEGSKEETTPKKTETEGLGTDSGIVTKTLEELGEEGEEEIEEEQEEESEQVSSEASEESEEASSIKVFAEHLVNKGILDIDIEEFEDSEEGLEEAIQGKIDSGVKDYKSNLGDMSNKFIEFIENGGNPQQFIQTYSAPDYNNVDLEALEESEGQQKSIVTELLLAEGYSQEEIREEIADLEDGGILFKQSKRSLSKLKKLQAATQEQLQASQKAAKENSIKQQEEFLTSLENQINSSDDIAGFEVKAKDKKRFFEYITKVDKRTGKTALIMDSEADKDSQLKMAWLYFNKFNFDKVKKQATKEVTSNLKSKLENATASRGKRSSIRKSTPKETSSNFGAFRSVL